MKRVIITGANGFIGKHLTKYLLSLGIEVYAFVYPLVEPKELVDENYDKLHTFCISLDDIDKIPEIIKERGFDCFYHFAWDGVYEPRSLDYKVQSANILNTCKAVEACKNIGCNRFIYPSSVMEYDCMRSALTSDVNALSKRTSYYGAKIGAYLLSKHYAFQIGVEFIEAIISNIYGPTLNPGFVTNTLIKFIKGEHASFTSGEQYYDFVHIDDAAISFYYIGAEGKPYASYYIGSECPRKLKYFIMDMRDCVDPCLEIGLGEIKTNVVDMTINMFDTQKLSRETNYKQTISFKEGITRTIDYLKKNI